jgi:antitoxin (DNA-binding transcriptional repressor) of toxin-antitoxin stability system
MVVTITKLRQNLFQLVDRALEGETVEFTYKGHRIRVVPEEQPSKLHKLVGQPVVAPGGLARASKDLLREMESEWKKDWAEL